MTTGFLALCIAATFTAQPVLLETTEVEIEAAVMAVDARPLDAFVEGHLPGATHLDVEALSEDRGGVSGLLKSAGELKALFAAAGLDPEKTLVVYTGQESAGDVKRATRLFWILEYAGFPKVRLLNGGLAKWKAEGRPVETGATSVSAVGVDTYSSLKFSEARLATRDEVAEARGKKSGLIVDLRDADYFTGKEKAGSAARAGHIPGAKNQPGDEFLEGPYFTFKAPEVIRDLLKESSGDGPVITYCNTGRVASVGYAAYRIAGFDDVALYDGSMSEWSSQADCPVATGQE